MSVNCLHNERKSGNIRKWNINRNSQNRKFRSDKNTLKFAMEFQMLFLILQKYAFKLNKKLAIYELIKNFGKNRFKNSLIINLLENRKFLKYLNKRKMTNP